MFWRRLLVPLMTLLFVAGSLLSGSLLSGCGDGDIRKGCKNYCKCHRGKRSDSACRKRCSEKLHALKERNRPRARQTADCLAAKGERKCGELAACMGDLLK